MLQEILVLGVVLLLVEYLVPAHVGMKGLKELGVTLACNSVNIDALALCWHGVGITVLPPTAARAQVLHDIHHLCVAVAAQPLRVKFRMKQPLRVCAQLSHQSLLL